MLKPLIKKKIYKNYFKEMFRIIRSNHRVIKKKNPYIKQCELANYRFASDIKNPYNEICKKLTERFNETETK